MSLPINPTCGVLVDEVLISLKAKHGNMAVEHKMLEFTAKMRVPSYPELLGSCP